MFRKNSKTVQKSVGARGMFGKIMSKFKTKTKPRIQKKITKPQARVQKKTTTKTKNGHFRKEVSKTSIFQVRKIFRIKTENPNLSTENIGFIVNMSGELVKYYLKIGKVQAVATFKNREHKVKTIAKKKESKLTKKQAGKNLNTLFKTEKYPTEHQSDPRYFGGSEPPQSVATVEDFDKQKRKNVINRAVVAKKIAQDNLTEQVNSKENHRKSRLREKHNIVEPKIHYDCCPSCNGKSNLTVDEYNKIVRQESFRRHQYAQKEIQLKEKEKQIDKLKQEPTVAEKEQTGTQLCRKCDSRIAYSQATRSYSIYGEYYCGDHEPNL
jgi:hypothetical protein